VTTRVYVRPSEQPITTRGKNYRGKQRVCAAVDDAVTLTSFIGGKPHKVRCYLIRARTQSG